jgi:hypothetical protein
MAIADAPNKLLGPPVTQARIPGVTAVPHISAPCVADQSSSV